MVQPTTDQLSALWRIDAPVAMTQMWWVDHRVALDAAWEVAGPFTTAEHARNFIQTWQPFPSEYYN